MAQERAKRPRSAERRTLPPDTKSLTDMIRSVHRHIHDRAAHLKSAVHDFHARRGFQTLFEQRAAAWGRLHELAPSQAEQLRLELGLVHSTPSAEVA
jgi:ribosomal protein S15P/S13E